MVIRLHPRLQETTLLVVVVDVYEMFKNHQQHGHGQKSVEICHEALLALLVEDSSGHREAFHLSCS